MSEGIRDQLERNRREVERLVEQYGIQKQKITSSSSRAVVDVFSEGIGYIAESFTESTEWGRIGKKWSRGAMENQQKHNLEQLETKYNQLLEVQVREIKEFLSTVSVLRRTNSNPNTDVILRRFEKINERSTFKGKANRLVEILSSLQAKKLVPNSELHKLSTKTKHVIVDPSTPYSAKREIENILKQASAYVYLIDAYVDTNTLDILLTVPKGIPIRILTQKRPRWPERKFCQQCRDFEIERPGFEIRTTNQKVFHDRYLLTDKGSWQFGASLKDFGKTMTTQVKLEEHASAKANELFGKFWTESVPLNREP